MQPGLPPSLSDELFLFRRGELTMDGKRALQVDNSPQPESQGTAGAGADYDALSFDVFDTMLCRTWLEPSDLFFVLGRRMQSRRLTAVPDAAIRQARLEAEKELRKLSDSGETTLADIHAAFCRRLGLDPALASTTAEIEMELEVSSIRPIASSVARAKAMIGRGEQVLYSTDTYFSSRQLQTLLGAAAAPLLEIFASSEVGASKRSGAIYAKIAARYPRLRLHHVGDKLQTDVLRARAAGWSSEHFLEQRALPFEEKLAAASWTDPLAGSAVAGAARAARLAQTVNTSVPREIAAIGSGVVGPLFSAFAGWCLAEARRQGIERLLFLARDGQILARLAERLEPGEIAVRYAHASRQALYLPAVFSRGDIVWQWLEEKAAGSTGAALLARFGLTQPHVLAALVDEGFDLDACLGPETAQQLLERLGADDLTDLVLAEAARRRRLVVGYFANEVGTAKKVAIVDVGWKGRLQICLQRIFEDDGGLAKLELSGLYLSLLSASELIGRGSYRRFIPYSSVTNAPLIEILASADHGTTTGYEPVDGKVVPTLEAQDPEAIIWITELQNAVLAFAANLVANARDAEMPLAPLLQELIVPAVRAYQHFAAHPTPGEAGALGDIEHSDDVRHQGVRFIAPAVSATEVGRLILTGRLKNGRSLFWAAGTIARSIGQTWIRAAAQNLWRTRTRLGKLKQAARPVMRKLIGRKRRI
jgi:predicted HAD superfamily hydrolase